jgi:hypothetical protein
MRCKRRAKTHALERKRKRWLLQNAAFILPILRAAAKPIQHVRAPTQIHADVAQSVQ